MQLHDKQKQAVNPSKRWFVDRAGRRGGKTIVKIERMLYRGLASDVVLSREFKNRSVIFLAPTQKQARTIVWEALKSRLPGIHDANESRLEMKIINEEGGYTTIFVGGWENRENYRGMSNVVWIEVDETDTLKDFFISWTEIFRPMLAETGGGAGFSGTPKAENPNLRRLEKEAEGKIDWQCTHWTSKDNPYFSDNEIEKAREEMDPVTFRQEFLAEYIDNLGALFNYDALLDVFTNAVEPSEDKFLIVDVADDGTDKTIFSYWNGLEEYRRDEHAGMNTEAIIDYIREITKQERIPMSHTAVDAIGVGAGVASSSILAGIIGYKSSFSAFKTDMDIVRLPNVSYAHDMKLTSDYKNLRSQCIFTLAEHVNNHKIASRVEGQLKEMVIEELSTYQDASPGDGKRMATKKGDVKVLLGRSPDNSDTWIMRMYFVIKDRLSPVQNAEISAVIDKQIERMRRVKGSQSVNSLR